MTGLDGVTATKMGGSRRSVGDTKIGHLKDRYPALAGFPTTPPSASSETGITSTASTCCSGRSGEELSGLISGADGCPDRTGRCAGPGAMMPP